MTFLAPTIETAHILGPDFRTLFEADPRQTPGAPTDAIGRTTAHIAATATPDTPVMTAVIQGLQAGLQHMQKRGDLSHTFRESAEELTEAATTIAPLADATLALAGWIDQDAKTPRQTPYHNRLHFVGATLAGFAITRAHLSLQTESPLPPVGAPVGISDFHRNMFTQAAHDIGHPGTNNGQGPDYVPMQLENQSLGLAMPFLTDAGVSSRDIDIIGTAILLTDPATPKKVVDLAARHHFSGLPLPRPVYNLWLETTVHRLTAPTDQNALRFLGASLRDDPEKALAAATMADADLFGSFGLGAETGAFWTRRLHAEFAQNAIDATKAVPLVDANGTPLPGGQLFALYSIVGTTRDPLTGAPACTFETPGGNLLGRQNALMIQKDAEQKLGPKATQGLRAATGVLTPCLV
jgi:hypothetical protein